jgi:outer membrane receptor protein involved in Fe transport
MSYLYMRICAVAPAILAAACVLSTAAFAADADSAAPVNYEEIVVQAVRGTKLKDLDVSTTVIPPAQIEQSPENSVEGILQRTPGVVMPMLPANELHPTGDPIELRGFGSTPGRTLVMVDGIPFNDPYFRYLDWQQIPKEDIERIEVIRGGGATTLWGNMAMAGVINIVTREPQPDELRASVGYGSFNTFRFDGSVTAYSSDKLIVGLDYSHEQTDGFNKVPASQNSPIFGNTSSQSNDGDVAAYLTPDDDQKYYLKLGAHYMKENGLQEAIANNAWGTYDSRLGGTIDLADGSKIEASGFYDQWHFSTQNASDQCYNQFPTTVSASSHCPGNIASPANASSYLGQIENAPYLGEGGSVVWKPDLASLGLTDILIGFDGRVTSAKDGIQVYSRANPTAVIIAKPFVDVHGQHHFEGGFAQGTYHVEGIPLDITLGLREDFWQLTGGSVSGAGLPDANFDHFDPRLGVKYQLTDTVSLRAAVYEGFDAPGMNQTFRSYLSGTALTLGNTDLRPETNTGGEGGVAFHNDAFDVQANGFYNYLDNFIQSGKLCNSTAACGAVAIPSVFGAGSTYTSITKNFNAGQAVISGGEIIATWRISDSVALDGSWTRTIAQITDNFALSKVVGGIAAANAVLPTGTQLGGVPAWTALLTLRWEPIEGLHLTGSLRSWPGFWTGTAHPTSGRNSGATIADAGAEFKFLEHYALFFNVQNITGRLYLTSAANFGASTTAPSNIGTPFNVFGGFRVAY